jgi:hypothetical protein|tara:strand:+ start:230 stop:514 length:285 start_codon:yes stop_codon:yes gene_type:complete
MDNYINPEYIQTKKPVQLNPLNKIAISLAISILREVIQSLLNMGYSEERIKEAFGVIILEGVKGKTYREYDSLTREFKNNIHAEESMIDPYGSL